MKIMGIEVIEIGDDYLVVIMFVIFEYYNFMGMVYGGVNVVLVEIVVSYVVNFVVDFNKFYVVG